MPQEQKEAEEHVMPKTELRDLSSIKIKNDTDLLKELREREEELRRRRGLRGVHAPQNLLAAT